MTHERYECEILGASRMRLVRLIEAYDPEILFQIPEEFNNNIIWQMGHCITSQQRHLYMRSKLPMHISKTFEDAFKIGSSPALWTTAPNIAEVKHLLMDTVNRLEADLQAGIFVNYEPFTLPIGFQVNNHLQALQAVNYHEAEHSGIIFTYLKLLGK